MTGTVHVWLVPVELPAWAGRQCRDALDPGERERAAAYHDPMDRQRFLVAHGALRLLAGRLLGTPPGALVFRSGRQGKPDLGPAWPGWHCGLSHCGDLVAVAVARRAVGVDVQRLAAARDPVALSHRFFAPAEAGHVAAGADPVQRADRFARLWVRKEAVVKALGGSLGPNLRIAVGRRDVVGCVRPPGTCRVSDLTAPAGYRAAVALAGPAAFAVVTAGWPDSGAPDQDW